MFLRRKPPQLPMLEELQQTYNDCCNLTIKNLTLEEENEVEEALKGWKSLHTSLLFKIELFDKNASKMSSEELSILDELKAIRDQNVKHLIRVQLRMDELNRRQHVRPPVLKVSSLSNSNMTVPSLRTTGGMRSGLNHNSAQKKKMLKSLRPEKSISSMNKLSQKQASVAANAIWAKPKPVIKTYDDDLFQNFDQDLELNQWEKLTDEEAPESPTNLIDLEDDYFELSCSMENLTLRPNKSKSRQSSMSSVTSVSASPTNTMRANGSTTNALKNTSASSTLKLNASTGNLTNIQLKVPSDNLGPPSLDTRSASTSDIKQEKKYVYNKPKPMNLNHLMKQTSYAKVPVKKTAPAPKVKAAAPAKKVTPAKAPVKPQEKQAKKSNITYNYVPLKKPLKPTKAPLSPASPTMDDIIDGYDVADAEDETEIAALNGDPVGLGLEPDLLDEKVQDELINSIRGIDPVSAKQILNDIVVHGDEVYWDDIVGLEGAKNSLKEAVVYPFLRPDLFQGLREPTRGMLLFGPPGTGKTMLARAVATESKSTFFSITSSSITSKYLGESEKLVKAMFLLAKKLSPSIVFIDEIDSLLGSRNEGEIESSRRIKNEFLVQWSELSSATTKETETTGLKQQVLILGATNMPWSIDEAARRRFVKRVYIPLPEPETRMAQILRLLKYQNNTIAEADYDELIRMTHDFSGSDITALCKDSAMGPLRSLGDKLLSTPTEQIRPINIEDFKSSLKYIRPSVLKESLSAYEDWSVKYGSSGV